MRYSLTRSEPDLDDYDRDTLSYLESTGVDGALLRRVHTGLAVAKRLRSDVQNVRTFAEKMAAEAPKPQVGGFMAEEILAVLDGKRA